MKKIVALVTLAILIFSCSNKKQGNMLVQGQIKGLKKGTLYLQKMNDTVLVSIDSVKLLGDDTFLLSDNVKDPVMYYLTFDGNTTEKRIMFFGEEGTITINDKIEQFGFNPEVTGSKNQDIIKEFKKIDARFKNQRLDFIKQDFEARKVNDEDKIKQLEDDYKRMMRKRFLFTAQFAKNNADTEAAPYLALTELFDANVRLLDTINNSLTPKVKASDYGKRLQKFINEVKANETK
ncbi:DUF4369 domain-containing protein [Tenacibaculum aquimarinum]|uniref:DUF4369 domain-containing protein n=1 Tax=Tenacibaculum aquimarinum TaxID=2910675 RepID=UPI001F0AB252|nr:DUF4369 domain-containing protein [Tenacibaculum aquimarinum]MCH3884709.1 DUF4369 domain-containing protein [Tenacibaculum aquimarinum]